MAQLGSARAWGARGPRFESGHPDHCALLPNWPNRIQLEGDLSYNVLDPQKTALVFFDMLNAYVHTSKEQERITKPFVDNCQKVLSAARSVNVPVYYARADHRHDGKDSANLYSDTSISGEPWSDPEEKPFKPYLLVYAGDWSSEIIPELQPRQNDYIIAKHRWNAFFQTHLELSLRTRGIDTIILCGGATEVGIASTAYCARDSDFNIVVVSDACRSGNQDNHEQFMNRIFPFMARVRTTDQVIAMVKG